MLLKWILQTNILEAVLFIGVVCSYASSFRFAGDHVDKRNLDISGRRKTRIVAIDALCMAGMKQYALKYLLQYCQYERLFQDRISRNDLSVHEASSTTVGTNGGVSVNLPLGNSATKNAWHLDQDCRGIATGNWGCGASGGDPELKTIIQWLAASQALQPFTSHYTFGIEAKWVGFGIKTERVARLFYYELRVLAKSASRSRSTSWRNLNQSLSNFKLLGNRQVDVGIN